MKHVHEFCAVFFFNKLNTSPSTDPSMRNKPGHIYKSYLKHIFNLLLMTFTKAYINEGLLPKDKMCKISRTIFDFSI